MKFLVAIIFTALYWLVAWALGWMALLLWNPGCLLGGDCNVPLLIAEAAALIAIYAALLVGIIRARF